jgi:FG-GAP-like repeat
MAYAHRASMRPRRGAAGLAGLLGATGCFQDPTVVDTSSDAATSSGSTAAGTSPDGPDSSGAGPTGPTSADATGPTPQTGSDDSGSGDTGPMVMCGDGVAAPGELCLGEVVVTIVGGGEARTMYGADFDGDAHLDLVISSPTTATLFLGDGVGGFAVQDPFTTIEFGIGSGDLAIARLDADATTDLVASNGAATVAGMLGDGRGGFGSAITSMYPGINAFGLLPGDYTSDGVTDVLVARISGFDVHFGVGTGSGAFTFTTQLAVAQAGPMIAGDFDGDGDLDAVIAQSTTQALTWLQGSGSDTMTPEDVPMGVGLGFGRPAAADLDGDGTDDAVFPIADTDQVAVVFGAPATGPTAPVLLDTTGEPAAAAIADLDRDGALDVVSCGAGLFAVVSVWRGDGTGGFAPVQELPVTPCAHLVLGDLDDDGADDVAYHHGGPGGLRVVLAQP